jgi:sec-independent protein translocase protein TatA
MVVRDADPFSRVSRIIDVDGEENAILRYAQDRQSAPKGIAPLPRRKGFNKVRLEMCWSETSPIVLSSSVGRLLMDKRWAAEYHGWNEITLERRPFMFGIGHAPEIIILLIIVLLVFGPGKLPEIGSAVGRGIREFRDATTGSGSPQPMITPAAPPQTIQQPAQQWAPPAPQAQPGQTPTEAYSQNQADHVSVG